MKKYIYILRDSYGIEWPSKPYKSLIICFCVVLFWDVRRSEEATIKKFDEFLADLTDKAFSEYVLLNLKELVKKNWPDIEAEIRKRDKSFNEFCQIMETSYHEN